MFRYNHIGVNSAIAVSLTQYNELADAVTKGRKKEGMKRGKWLQNRIAGLPKDGFKLKDLSPDTNWLALYVSHFLLNVVSDVLILDRSFMRSERAMPGITCIISAVHTRRWF